MYVFRHELVVDITSGKYTPPTAITTCALDNTTPLIETPGLRERFTLSIDFGFLHFCEKQVTGFLSNSISCWSWCAYGDYLVIALIFRFPCGNALLLPWGHRWLRDHDPSAVDGLLESALLGKDNKTKLAAARTLLAVADALAEVKGKRLLVP